MEKSGLLILLDFHGTAIGRRAEVHFAARKTVVWNAADNLIAGKHISRRTEMFCKLDEQTRTN